MITRSMISLVHKKNQQWWVYLGSRRVGFIAANPKQDGWIWREVGFNHVSQPARTKNEALDRLIKKLNS